MPIDTLNGRGEILRIKLSEFRSREGFSVVQLAKYLDKPASTVYQWLDGRSQPSRKTINYVCKLIGLDYASVFDSGGGLRDKVRRELFSYDQLQFHYSDLQKHGQAFHAAELVGHCTVMIHSHMVRYGLVCEFQMTKELGSRIALDERGSFIAVYGEPREGIKLRVEEYLKQGQYRQTTFLPKLVTDDVVNVMVDQLLKIE